MKRTPVEIGDVVLFRMRTEGDDGDGWIPAIVVEGIQVATGPKGERKIGDLQLFVPVWADYQEQFADLDWNIVRDQLTSAMHARVACEGTKPGCWKVRR